ncbi:MAG: flagellar basal body-associated FliL family protein [Oscillospiraceae bacterium]|nr:flagellar basal body-associated FliL family protein [Oscillospiraceae bacterium]
MTKTVKILIAVIIVIVLGASGAIAFVLTRNTSEREEPRFIYDPGTSFITNVQEDSSLAKTTLVIQVIGAKTLAALTEDSVKVNDSIISVLREKTKDEMTSPEIQERLKVEICERLEQDLNIEGIETIYFSEFVVTN